MTEAELNISNEELLSKLKLLSNGKLKRSAVLLFYGDPSIVQVGSFVKVGNGCVITVNAGSYTIITAHREK